MKARIAAVVVLTLLALSALGANAPRKSPTFTGVPKAPTAAAGTNTTQIATTAFVEAAKSVMGPTGTLSTSPHVVIGTATLSSNTVTVTLTNAAVFTSSSSYRCTANDNTTVEAVKIVQTSGTSITFSNTTGATDVVSYICIGN